MKTKLTKKDYKIINNAVKKVEIYLKKQGASNFIQFHLNFIKGFASLFLIKDQDFLSLIESPDDIEMRDNSLIYIRSLSVKHPLYNFFKQFNSLPNFMQEDIMEESVYLISNI